MPSGKTHDKITIVFLPILILILYFLNIPNISLIIICGFLFSSFMFNGDLDIVSRPYNRWLFLKIIWIPYQSIFSHRSTFTHGLVIGTLVRLLYIMILPISYMYFNNIDFSFLYTNQLLISFYIGLEIGSALHTISDKTVSFFN